MIEYNEKMLSLDSSKISDYMRCPRYFFYRHILGWKKAGVSHDLIFGESWHRAKEFLLINGFVDGWIDGAMDAFNAYYRQHYLDITDLDRYPKSPAGARESLELYEKQYKDTMNFELSKIKGRPATEVYGTVPIDDDGNRLHFRMDAIGMNQYEKIAYMDHKSTKSDNPIYQQVWSISTQMMTYYHALVCIAGANHIGDVYGGIVDLSIFRKGSKGHEHKRIPIRKTMGMLNEWLVNVSEWVRAINFDVKTMFDLMSVFRQKESMPVFRRCDHGCTAYYTMCPFFDLCTMWENPLQRCDEVPLGYEQEYWDPSVREEGKTFVEVS